jgi:hypothetical protein
MKSKIFASLMAVMFSFLGQVNAAEPTPPVTTVSVGGTNYSVTYSTQSFANLESTLTLQPWWGDAELALEFVNEVGNDISYFELDAGLLNPLFVVSFAGEYIGVVFSSGYEDGRPSDIYGDPEPVDFPIGLCGVDNIQCAFAIATRLFAGPTASDTLNSLRPNAFALRNAFNLQSAKIAQGLSYDCTVYDQKNICVSFAGSKSDGKGFDATTGALIIAHKPTNNFRFGGYIDQSFGSSSSGGLTTKNGNPGFGAFAVWSQNPDGSGVQVRAAANVGKVDIETTREAIDSAEAGFGKSNIKSQGFSLEVSKDYALNSMWSARPYVGYRKTTNTRAGYTEQSSDDVTAPLTYGSLKQNTETVTAGATFAHTLSAKTTLFLTAGIEHDLKNSIGRYAATWSESDSIDSIEMGSNKTKTRPTVSFALNHDIDKTQRVGVSLTHRKEAFASGSTTSAFLQYSKGF